MAVFAISDLHLARSIDKPMDVFGARWQGYMDKLDTYWRETVGEEDWVVIPGDISWATYLEQAYADFKFIDELPGKKVISKGNHDYWWTTHNKLQKFITENGFSSIQFMHNNSFNFEGTVMCGTRGWKCPGDEDFSAEDRKIYNRELQRLELSLKSVGSEANQNIMVALHYPPFNSKKEPSEFVDILEQYGVRQCFYGHLHGDSQKGAMTGVIRGVEFSLVAADYLGFKPKKVL